MKDSVWLSKLKDKIPYVHDICPAGGGGFRIKGLKKGWCALKGKERTERHCTKKLCVCGGHSIRAHKERWKYPERKRKR
jgi:hypothetical protein